MADNADSDWTWTCNLCQVNTTTEWDDELEQDIGLPAFAAPFSDRVINICDAYAGIRGPHELTELARTLAENSER